MNNKGFTLLELLAVSVVLAFIAIISVPKIATVVQKTEVKSIEQSAIGFIDAVEKQISLNNLNNGSKVIKSGTYDIDTLTNEDYRLVIKGKRPTSGSWVKIENTKVVDYELAIGDYTISYDEVNKKMNVKKVDSNLPITKPITLIKTNATYDGRPYTTTIKTTSDEATNVTYYSNSTCTTAITGSPVNAGTYYAKVSASNNEESLECTEAVVINKAKNTLVLSSNSGTVTYPGSTKFIVKTNTSNGTLSCISSNTSAATCSISGSTVTVQSGTKATSNVIITVKSAATTNYKEATASYLVTSKLGTLSVTANGYSGTYDGQEHGIKVISSGATIKYGTSACTDKTPCTLTNSPTRKSIGTTSVYYQVTKEGYKTVTGSKDITINQANNPIIVSARTNLVYTGKEQNLVIVSGAQENVCYSITSPLTSCNAAGSLPTGINGGSYTVYYYVAGNNNYESQSGQVIVTILAKNDTISLTNKTTTYDGQRHEAEINTTSGIKPTVTYYSDATCATAITGSPVNVGTYYAKASTAGNSNYKAASLSCTKAVTINKANNTLILSANIGEVTYPGTTSVNVNTNTSGGTLSCTSSNTNAATCSISGSTVTVQSGTTAASATITVTSAETTNYKAAQAAYTVTSKLGTLSVSASDKTVTYNGSAQGISVTSSGATIRYRDGNGNYTLTSSPTYTNAGTYTIYYQVSKTGYTTVTSSKTLTINKASGSVNTAPTGKTVDYTGGGLSLANAGSCNGGTMYYKLSSASSYGTGIPSATNPGTYTINYYCVGDSNHNNTSAGSITARIRAPFYGSISSQGNLITSRKTGEKFYYIATASGNAILFSQYNVDPSTNVQSTSAPAIPFSGTGSLYPGGFSDGENLNNKAIVRNDTNSAVMRAYRYGQKFGVNGRLLTTNELAAYCKANIGAWDVSASPSFIKSTNYFYGSAFNNGSMYFYSSRDDFNNDYWYNEASILGLRPVLDVPTSLIDANA